MTTTLSNSSSGPAYGSTEKTSSAAPATLPAFERRDERVLVDELAARRVDQANTVAHLRERARVQRARRLGREREMQREELRRGVDLTGRLDPLDAELAEPIGRDERVVREHAHAETARTPRDLLPDAAEAEHAERLPCELDAAVRLALPAALLERGMRLRDVARERDEQADRVLGGRHDGRLGRVRDDDAAPRRRVDVDVVDPDARAADHLQARRAVDQVCGELRRRADDDRVVAVDDLGEIAVRVDVDVEALAQQLDARGRDRLADENPLSHATRLCSYASSAAVTATPRSMSAPSSESTSSTAASIVAMSKTSNQPMWPRRKILP